MQTRLRLRSRLVPGCVALSLLIVGFAAVTIAQQTQGTLPGAIEDQQLVLDEHGFGDHGTGAARAGESGDGRQQMQNKDGQIAHRRS